MIACRKGKKGARTCRAAAQQGSSRPSRPRQGVLLGSHLCWRAGTGHLSPPQVTADTICVTALSGIWGDADEHLLERVHVVRAAPTEQGRQEPGQGFVSGRLVRIHAEGDQMGVSLDMVSSRHG